MLRLTSLLFFLIASLTPVAHAAAVSSEAKMVAENQSIAPGAKFSVALQLSHPEGWHSYYQNSGGVELPPSIRWTLPEGFTAGPIQWPSPEVKEGYFGKSFVYQDSPVFLVEITSPTTLSTGSTITLTADAAWQICKESCINEKASFSLTLATGTSITDPAAAPLFASARASLPQPSPAPTLATSHGASVILRISSPTAPTNFIPDQPFLKAASDGGSITQDGKDWLIKLNRKTKSPLGTAIPQGDSLSGILLGAQAWTIPPTRITPAPPESLALAPFLRVLGGMFLGGLILNLMPCVFPVIGLKIMGFVQQAGSDRRKIALHGLVFTLGVLLSFGILSGILFSLRSAGSGWGYQLQDPRVVLTLMLVMFVLALNMFGVFELGTSATSIGGSLQSKQGLAGSFFSGVLATVVATPCSGPLLGAAIGAAFGLPGPQFFASFTAMALGLSLPYLILSAFPNLIALLPRPGAWMESFKQAMSFLLFATAGYLLWVYGGQIGQENLLAPILGLCTIATAAWIYGRWNLPHRSATARRSAIVLTLALAAAGILLAKPPAKSALTWEKWSQERVDELLDEGSPVFVDFTAQWCATCQVNKKRAYSPEVISLMKQKGIIALKADKTSPDPAIEAKLQELGRTAIPVNVLLQPDSDPVVTPELLSPSYLLELFGKLPDKPAE